MKPSIKVEGLADVERVMMNLPKATAKASARRILKKAGTVVLDAIAPPKGNTGDLAASYSVGTRLNNAQRKQHRRESEVEMFVGSNDPAAVQQEFGNVNHAPQAHLRPAWDGRRQEALQGIATEFWAEVQRTVARYQKRMAKGRVRK